MAVVCHFWRISPREFWDLDIAEYRAMIKYQEKVNEEQERQISQVRSRSRRRR